MEWSIALQVTRYLEFKTVDGSYVVKGGKVNKVRQTGREGGRSQHLEDKYYLSTVLRNTVG